MSYLVIVNFSTTNPAQTLPPAVNMEFEEGQVLDAAEYYYACLTYFEAAKKWDPVYYQVAVDLHFWAGDNHLRHITY